MGIITLFRQRFHLIYLAYPSRRLQSTVSCMVAINLRHQNFLGGYLFSDLISHFAFSRSPLLQPRYHPPRPFAEPLKTQATTLKMTPSRHLNLLARREKSSGHRMPTGPLDAFVRVRQWRSSISADKTLATLSPDEIDLDDPRVRLDRHGTGTNGEQGQIKFNGSLWRNERSTPDRSTSSRRIATI